MRGRGWTLLISNFRNPAGFLKFEYVNMYFLELGSDVDVTARQIPKSKEGLMRSTVFTLILSKIISIHHNIISTPQYPEFHLILVC